MVEVAHSIPEPAFLARQRADGPNGPWDQLPATPERQEPRRQLSREQEGLCAYCEQSLDPDAGHIDHVKPKALHPELTFEYRNLIHSCDARKQCGHFKQSRPIPVEPRPGANRHFVLSEITGRLSADQALSSSERTRAETTLDRLGLNRDPGLNRQRQQYAASLRALHNPDEVAEFLSAAPFRWSLRRIV